jgi:hypothetical protein
MTTMIALLGEQPMPILLPALYLKPSEVILVHTSETEKVAKRLQQMIKPSKCLKVDPYKLATTTNKIEEALSSKSEIVLNLTGGTKLMAIAAFSLLDKVKGEFVYLQTESSKPILKRYCFNEGDWELLKEDLLPELITVKDYLNAHLPGFTCEGFSKDERGQLTIGGKFEKAIYDVLVKAGFEVLAGVRPNDVGNQIEIDLVIRLANRVGIAEIKLGDKQQENPKKGIDQLSTAGGREYLGTYTSKFLILARRLNNSLRTLANNRDVTVIDNINYIEDKPLSIKDAEDLIRTIKARLTR